MTDVLSQTYGRPGAPGNVEVAYLHGLRRGDKLTVKVGSPGKGGAGGPPAEQSSDGDSQFTGRGGAGGGRENLPIIDAFKVYTERHKGADKEPLCFLKPGEHEIEWPYSTPPGTLVQIDPGGGGGGGAGDTLPGEDGEDGLPGATFIFPTYLPSQRPRE